MKEIIYIVTNGSYSDYRIVAVYDNNEMAQQHANSLPDAQVEEYEINQFADKLKQGLFAFEITMQKDGTVIYVHKKGFELDDWDNTPSIYCRDGDCQLSYPCYAKSEEHATKIANEKRLQLIAADKWIEGEIS
jgi:hypothetical protein